MAVLTAKELAELTGLSDITISRYRRQGMPAVRVGGKLFYFGIKTSVDWMHAHAISTEKTRKLSESFTAIQRHRDNMIEIHRERIEALGLAMGGGR